MQYRIYLFAILFLMQFKAVPALADPATTELIFPQYASIPTNGSAIVGLFGVEADVKVNAFVDDGLSQSLDAVDLRKDIENLDALLAVDLSSLDLEAGQQLTFSPANIGFFPPTFEVVDMDVSPPTLQDAEVRVNSSRAAVSCCLGSAFAGECGFRVVLAFTAATDPSGIAYYEALDEDSESLGVLLGHGPDAEGAEVELSALHPGLERTEFCIQVDAIDLAGNRTPYDQVCVQAESDLECSEPEPTAQTCFCTAAPTGTAAAASMFLLSFLAVAFRRRRSSQ